MRPCKEAFLFECGNILDVDEAVGWILESCIPWVIILLFVLHLKRRSLNVLFRQIGVEILLGCGVRRGLNYLIYRKSELELLFVVKHELLLFVVGRLVGLLRISGCFALSLLAVVRCLALEDRPRALVLLGLGNPLDVDLLYQDRGHLLLSNVDRDLVVRGGRTFLYWGWCFLLLLGFLFYLCLLSGLPFHLLLHSRLGLYRSLTFLHLGLFGQLRDCWYSLLLLSRLGGLICLDCLWLL